MNKETLIAFALFSIVAAITPGPNNLMLLASGANFGFRRTLPHLFGITGGFFALSLAVGLGLGSILLAYPELHLTLKILGGAYLIYLAWRIAISRSIDDGENSDARPMSFAKAVLFQAVNPKAWVMAITGMAVYTDPARPLVSVLPICVAFTIFGFPCSCIWLAFGTRLRTFLSQPVRLKWFNITMAILLVASVIPLVR